MLGIDPGSRVMGYGLVEEEDGRLRAAAWGTIKPDRDLTIERRLAHLYAELLRIIDRWEPQDVAVEDPFVGRNPKAIFALGQAQAVVLLACAQRGLSVHRYAPAQTKRAVADYGNASKERMAEMVRLTLEMDGPEVPEDASDALAVALCHVYRKRLEGVLAREIGDSHEM